MSVLSQKTQIFGEIASSRTLIEGLPQLKTSASFPSINNGGDCILFLTDIIQALVGYDALQQTIENILVYSLDEIEREIKIALKSELKSIVNCGVNPSLPSFIKSTGNGLNFTVNKVDFTNLMLTDPNSDAGKLLYNDLTTNLIDSTDFNTFLYQTIQNNGSVESWGHATTRSDIVTFQFNAVDVSGQNPNNTLTVKAHPSYDNKSLTDLNNDYIDSVTLFNAQNLITNLVDSIFGTVSSVINKSLTQLENEAKINTIVNKIASSNSNDIISDNYFTFTNAETNAQQLSAKNLKAGQSILNTSTPFSASVSFSTLQTANSNIAGATNSIDRQAAVSNSLNQIGSQVGAAASNPADANTVKLGFIQQIISNLIQCVVNSILSPKVVAIFIVNFKIIYGMNEDFTDSVDFLLKNKNLLHDMIKQIGAIVVKILLKFALGEIAKLVAQTIVLKQIDKNKLKIAQILSLLGVPSSVIAQINGLL